jgi:hypothetical protein
MITDALDAVIAALRLTLAGVGLPTVAVGELLFTPLVWVGFAFQVRNVWVMSDFRRRLRREARTAGLVFDGELDASAKERYRRALRAALRLGAFCAIDVALLTNWQYSYVVFTFGLLFYGFMACLDGILDAVYEYARAQYWARRDAQEDYAEQMGRAAVAAAERAEAAVVTSLAQATRIETAIAANQTALEENTALTREAASKSAAAETAANHVNAKIAAVAGGLAVVQTGQAAALVRETARDERDERERSANDPPA